MKTLFNPIEDDEDVTEIIVKFFTWVSVSAAFVIVAIAFWSIIKSEQPNQTAAFTAQMNQQSADEQWRKEHRRLQKKHGYPHVVFEPGKTPYFYDKDGKKCKFI